MGPHPAPPRTSIARRRSAFRPASQTIPLAPLSSNKHREPPTEPAMVCSWGNMVERIGVTE